ncbi:hypothetical protein Poly30_42780 [Planctomycetes bacterium Poly30]|uniref:Uncharacterized protein n=1 Tax=Saltatorellus ferox TaxID=2528018 RepID=A0A518EXB3_9BACT|nr:hypothetical protein Poly30_42780 [Planctomycetes bacterium Poly30]
MSYVLGQMKDMDRTGIQRRSVGKRALRVNALVTLTGTFLAGGMAISWAAASPGTLSSIGDSQSPPPQDEVETAEAALETAFAAAGIYVDRKASAVAFPVSAEVRSEYLEYVLVNPHGAIHESLLVTPVGAQVLGAAFLSIGTEAGKNVEYVPKDPPPTPEEARAGARTHDTIPPSGKPLYLYVAWRESAGVPNPVTGEFPGETLHFHRLEDLIVDLERDRTLRRHGWVWLGSRMLPPAKDGLPERFAADVTGNLACVSFFPQGDTLLTPALPECESQTSWVANRWLLPAPGAPMLLMGSTEQLAAVPESFELAVPLIPPGDADPRPASGTGEEGD